MNHRAVSIRPFIGSKDYTLSRGFYKDLGFEESVLSHNMCYFHSRDFGFYLQDAYVRDWVDNTMVFMEVVDVNQFWTDLVALDLPKKYPTCRVIPVKDIELLDDVQLPENAEILVTMMDETPLESLTLGEHLAAGLQDILLGRVSRADTPEELASHLDRCWKTLDEVSLHFHNLVRPKFEIAAQA